MEGLWRDVRLGLRALKAAPVVTIVATLSIALGIGANTAIFSLIDSLAVYRSLRDPIPATAYLPFAQSREASAFAMMSLSIRTNGPPATLVRSVSDTLEDVNPDLTWAFRPLDEQIAASITQERMTASLAALFGGLALLLAAVGLYGVTAYSVSRRRSEIGIRIALGADTTRVVRLVMMRVTVLVAVGAALGAAASLWLSQFVTPLLYGLDSNDPATLVGAVGVLVSIGLAAGLLPALTAARIDPAALFARQLSLNPRSRCQTTQGASVATFDVRSLRRTFERRTAVNGNIAVTFAP